MVIKHATDIALQAVDMEGSKSIEMRLLLSESDGAPNFIMRLFEVAPGGNSPYHFHDYEHEVYVLEGEGTVTGETGKTPLTAGDVVLVLPNEKHQFHNRGETPFVFLCFIPKLN